MPTLRAEIHWLILVLLLLAPSAGGPAAAADDAAKSAQIEAVMAGLDPVRRQIGERLEVAAGRRGELESQCRRLEAEIRGESRRREAFELSQALRHRRIAYDLRLLQQITAYIDQLDRRIDYFRKALETLDYCERRIRSELSLVKTFSAEDVAALSRQVQALLGEFSREAAAPLLRSAEVAPRRLETLWSRAAGPA